MLMFLLSHTPAQHDSNTGIVFNSVNSNTGIVFSSVNGNTGTVPGM